MIFQKNNFFLPSLSSHTFFLLPISLLLFGGGLMSCGNIAQLGNNTIKISDRAVSVTKIGDIQPNPQTATKIYLQGKVTIKAPFLTGGAYQLQDATGKIWVVTNQTLPSVGDEVAIAGEVKFQSIPISGQEIGEVYIQQEEELERKSGQPEASVQTSNNQ
jgi:hypothetical protein